MGIRDRGIVPTDSADRVADILEIMDRQALHAYRLKLMHPTKKLEVEFKADLPEDMAKLIDYLDEAYGFTQPPAL